jgi:hypothetical protein
MKVDITPPMGRVVEGPFEIVKAGNVGPLPLGHRTSVSPARQLDTNGDAHIAIKKTLAMIKQG